MRKINLVTALSTAVILLGSFGPAVSAKTDISASLSMGNDIFVVMEDGLSANHTGPVESGIFVSDMISETKGEIVSISDKRTISINEQFLMNNMSQALRTEIAEQHKNDQDAAPDSSSNVPVYTNINCILTEDNAPDAIKSVNDALVMYKAELKGKVMSVTSEQPKQFVYDLAGCDGVIKVLPGGNVEFIKNQSVNKDKLVFEISGTGAYAPVAFAK